jgi:hypothetical protein
VGVQPSVGPGFAGSALLRIASTFFVARASWAAVSPLSNKLCHFPTLQRRRLGLLPRLPPLRPHRGAAPPALLSPTTPATTAAANAAAALAPAAASSSAAAAARRAERNQLRPRQLRVAQPRWPPSDVRHSMATSDLHSRVFMGMLISRPEWRVTHTASAVCPCSTCSLCVSAAAVGLPLHAHPGAAHSPSPNHHPCFFHSHAGRAGALQPAWGLSGGRGLISAFRMQCGLNVELAGTCFSMHMLLVALFPVTLLPYFKCSTILLAWPCVQPAGTARTTAPKSPKQTPAASHRKPVASGDPEPANPGAARPAAEAMVAPPTAAPDAAGGQPSCSTQDVSERVGDL